MFPGTGGCTDRSLADKIPLRQCARCKEMTDAPPERLPSNTTPASVPDFAFGFECGIQLQL